MSSWGESLPLFITRKSSLGGKIVARYGSWLTLVGVLTSAVLVPTSMPLAGQLVPEHPINQMDLKIRTVRDYDQPVLPIFEGWYTNEDGTYDLCFGYFSLNRIEEVDIPVGPNNFIEPARFDGVQPTHFVPQGPRAGPRDPSATTVPGSGQGGAQLAGSRLEGKTCVFTVNVTEDEGRTERVWWNLIIDGQTYRVPGHINARAYRVDNLVNSTGASMEEFAENLIFSGDAVAPIVRFIEPPGPDGRGKTGVRLGPVTARLGTPLAITLANSLPVSALSTGRDLNLDEESGLSQQTLQWLKYSGPPGHVSFTPERSRVEVGTVPVEQTTRVTFSQPGDYVLLAQVLNGSFANQCCWTNTYLSVSVTR